MGKLAWQSTIASKEFNVVMYRKFGTLVVISMLLNFVLFYWASHIYFNRPPHTYYSTNGATPPALLTARYAPNESSTPLLGDDQEGDAKEKLIPE